MPMPNEQTHRDAGVIILAAGASSRLGSPKQLLPFSGTTLLQHSIDVAEKSEASVVIIITGANAEEITTNANYTKAAIRMNTAWQEGMASSIRCGLESLQQLHPQIKRVILMVADQPFVTTALLNDLMNVQEKESCDIVASNYEITFGTPVLFTKRFFPELMKLTGDVGAKSLVRKHLNETAFVSFPKGEVDIDTVEDYKKLNE